MPAVRAREGLNHNVFNARPAGMGNALPVAAPRMAAPHVRPQLHRNEFHQRPAGLGNAHPVGYVANPPYFANRPHMISPYPRPFFFGRPVSFVNISWYPITSFALAILGIGLIASICAPEAAVIIIPTAVILAIASVALKAISG